MFNEKLKEEYPFITSFLEAATGVRSKLSHAYMMFGSDISAQYALALEVARILNCEAPNNSECKCTNCAWIRQNKHPAVITISPADYTYGNKKGEAKTVITIEQARFLREELLSSSQYHRVVIFTDAQEGKEVYNKWVDFQQYGVLPPACADEDNTDRIWAPLPLTRKIFPIATANALLKTIEEPNSKIIFFFLTKDTEDVIETIVSRCQRLPVFPKKIMQSDINPINELLQDLFPQNVSEALFLSEKAQKLAKEENLNSQNILDMLAQYSRQNLAANAGNKYFAKRIADIVKKIEKSKRELISSTNEQAVFDELFISLID